MQRSVGRCETDEEVWRTRRRAALLKYPVGKDGFPPYNGAGVLAPMRQHFAVKKSGTTFSDVSLSEMPLFLFAPLAFI